MMGMALEMLRHDLLQTLLDFERVLARRQAGAVGNAEDMGVDRDGLVAEGDIQDHIRGLAPDAGQFLQILAAVRHLAAVFLEQQFRERDHILGLGAKETDGLDEIAQTRLAQRDHFRGAVGELEQGLGRLVDADIGRLGRQHDRHQQRIGIDVFELGGGIRAGLRQDGKEARCGVMGHAVHGCD